MSQFRPRRRSKPLATQTVSGAAGGASVDVASSAIRALAHWPADRVLAPTQNSTTALLAALDYDAICQAAVDAGATAPSKRTVRRWKQFDRIPDAATANLISRRGAIAQLGGVEATAQVLGRSKRTVYRWASGESELRGDARARLDEALARLRLTRSGIDSTTMTPRIAFTADVMVRHEGNVDYDYRHRKPFILGPPDGQDVAKGNRMSPDLVDEFAVAMARDDHGRMLSLLEGYCSVSVADFDAYDNANGFHFESISGLRVEW